MPNKKEAVVFVPGLRRAKQGVQLSKLSEGMIGATETRIVTDRGEVEIQGHTGRRLEVIDGERQTDLHLYECYWGDLVPDIEALAPIPKMKQGLGLVWFWLLSPVWGLLLAGNFWLGVWLIFAGVMLFAWYWTVLVVGFEAIGMIDVAASSAVRPAVQWFADFSAEMGGMSAWLGLSFFLSLFGVVRLANMAYFTRKYLRDPQLRNDIRRRVTGVLNQVLRDGSYDQVSVVGHSFGSIISIDTLADLPGDKPVRFVTFGVPLRILRWVEPWVAGEVRKCLANKSVGEWRDFSSSSDWLASPDWKWIRKQGDASCYQYVSLSRMGDMWQRLSGGTHEGYFSEQAPMELLTSQ